MVFSDALPPEGHPAGSNVESKCSATTKGEEEAEGFLRSEAEPSEVQDQAALPAEADHDGHQSDDEEADGDQSTNSGQSKESATCQQVVKLLTDVTNSLEVRNAAIPEDIQANEQSLDQFSPYGNNHGMEAPVPVLLQPIVAQSTALTPSAPPRVLNDQALRSHILQPKEKDQVNQ